MTYCTIFALPMSNMHSLALFFKLGIARNRINLSAITLCCWCIAVLAFVLPSAFALSEHDLFTYDNTLPYGEDKGGRSSLIRSGFREVINRVKEGVVAITVETLPETREFVLGRSTPYYDNPSTTKSLGSGFILNKEGFIATNYHVVAKKGRIMVKINGSTKSYPARLVGKDEQTDLALLQLDLKRAETALSKLKPLVVGDDSLVEVGDWVIAIGNQFELGQTVTVGVVSAKGRGFPGSGSKDYFIQTDAVINPGSSGGPLFDAEGRVIGINTAIYSPSKDIARGKGFNIGIGFATPISIAKRILSELYLKGRVTRGWLGVLIQRVTPEVARVFNLPIARGALVSQVIDRSPAQKAGIKAGDVILKFNGNEIIDNADLPLLVTKTQPGQKAEIEIIRNGETKTLTAIIGELSRGASRFESPKGIGVMELGMIVQDVRESRYREVDPFIREGIVVQSVNSVGPAALAGIKRGDLILSISYKGNVFRKVKDIPTFFEILRDIPPNEPVLLHIKRIVNNGVFNDIFIALKPSLWQTPAQ